ncbi:hypothetical protein [Pseudomonas mosselii]|uniref:Uncharacterized protein n=1 Tax=Pseudomonas mosselii TaxID=78327 RepID=A0A7W2JZJ9_9PSED|nr:hypothetical protein [Pseudomonas mosselii]MBA6068079.1 hypothetical protein [Pseudomonas mosselii]
MSALSYHGPVDLLLCYGEVPGLSRTAERPGVELGVSRPAPGEPAMVLVGPGLQLDLAKAPTSARLQLPDGTVIAGRISQADCHADTFLVLP